MYLVNDSSIIDAMSNHFIEGHPVMVDVSDKSATSRVAVAEAVVVLSKDATGVFEERSMSKGDPISVAELAGIMAAKKTSDLIPLCHQIPLSSVQVQGELDVPLVRFEALCKTTAQTGVEMEALTAVSVAALTLYDMLKGMDKGIEIQAIRLLSKRGGRSGTWLRS